MKWFQFFFIMSAIYISPHVSPLVSGILAAVWLVAGFIALFRKE